MIVKPVQGNLVNVGSDSSDHNIVPRSQCLSAGPRLLSKGGAELPALAMPSGEQRSSQGNEVLCSVAAS